MNRLLFVGAAILGLASAPAVRAGDDKDKSHVGESVTITGCVVVGDDPDTFVLTHVNRTDSPKALGSGIVLGAHGLEGTDPEVIYWLNHESAKQFRGMTGHRVEVSGTVTHVSNGSVKIEKELDADGRDNTITIRARGKKAHAKTDRPVDTNGPSTGEQIESKREMPVHRIKVASVRDVSAQCP